MKRLIDEYQECIDNISLIENKHWRQEITDSLKELVAKMEKIPDTAWQMMAREHEEEMWTLMWGAGGIIGDMGHMEDYHDCRKMLEYIEHIHEKVDGRLKELSALYEEMKKWNT